MANNKVGFGYWNAETDRYQDIKLKRLKKQFKGTGLAVHDYILNEIYRVKGYYISWDESTCFDVAEYFEEKESLINEIVNYCCFVGLFDKALLASGSILTSEAIQKRFILWSKFLKRKSAIIQEKFKIIQEECDIIQEESQEIQEVSQGRKRKEIKDIKEKKGKDAHAREDVFAPPVFDEVYSFFEDQIPDTFWDIAKCKSEAKAFIDYYAKTDWNTSNGPIVNWQNAASGWIRNDGKFEKEKKSKTSAGRQHPDHWSKTWEQSLSIPDMKDYWAHLRKLGFSPKKDHAGNVIGWHKV